MESSNRIDRPAGLKPIPDEVGPADLVLAVDIGGTGIKAALCDRDCVVLATADAATPVEVPDVLAAIYRLLGQLTEQAGDRTVRGVGLITPGTVDATAGVVRYAANVGWRDTPLAELVGRAVGLPVAVEHDVRAAGLAEAVLGAARGVPDALFVGIGTGIAAAGIVDGRPVAGAGNLAGEIGHLPAVPDGEPCACGQRGCAEVYASAAGISRRYRSRTGRTASAAEVIALAGQHDPDAGAIWTDALDVLARTVLGAVLLLDPALVVLGGGLSLAGDALLRPLATRIDAGLGWRPAPPLRTARFGDQAGRVGAALIGWQAVERQVGPTG